MRWLGLITLLLLLGTSPVASQVRDDRLIVPGVRVGKWTLSMTIDDLLRMNGPATRMLFTAGNAQATDAVFDYTVLGWWDRLPLGAATYDQKTVAFLTLWVYSPGSFSYKTDRGVGFGTTRSQVLKTYGGPTAETSPLQRLGQTRLIYDRMGIAFLCDGENVWTIDVFRPGTASRHWHLM